MQVTNFESRPAFSERFSGFAYPKTPRITENGNGK
jgi:hypothetical protein